METNTFGHWLRLQRKALDLTREAFADRVGCSAATIRKLEAEERRPSAQIVARLADIFSIPPDERAAFLRFARGDPFAALAEAESSSRPYRPPALRCNLPLQLTRFIGRETEIADVRRLLSQARLVTLTGVGGTGKTRLALQVAAGQLNHFPDGVWLVELAPLADPTLLCQTVAAVLGLREVPGRPLMDVLLDHLRRRRLLLVLDNCEHLIQGCAELAETLLRACPHLIILATSREALGVAGETNYHVPPLSLPDPNPIDAIDKVAQSEAARVFIQRAVATLPGFSVTSANAPAVAQICRRLDGIPLAIELAAARVRMLPVEQIASRLDDSFRLLTGGSRTALPRHQTLEALIDWSYALLTGPEQFLLRRLAVFAGGFTLEAAEAVGAGDGLPADGVVERLARLIDKSLVLADAPAGGASARYRQLEMIRQYALAKLEASGAADEARTRHLTYFLALAETDDPLNGPTLAWLESMESNHDNLRAALARAQASAGAVDQELRLVTALFDFWTSRGHLNEARVRFEAALARAEVERPQEMGLWVRALGRQAQLCAAQGDFAAARERAAAGLKLAEALGDLSGQARALGGLGWLAREQGDADTARVRLEESLALNRRLGNESAIVYDLQNLGEVAIMQADAARATALLEESLSLFRALHSREGTAWSLNHLGQVAQLCGEYARAISLHTESLTLFRELGQNNGGVAWAHLGLGETCLAQAQVELGRAHLGLGLTVFRELGDRQGMAMCLAGLAMAAAVDEDPGRAARLWAAAEALRQSIGARGAPASRVMRERLSASAREQLGHEAFAAAWAAGQKLTVEQAIELALQSQAEA